MYSLCLNLPPRSHIDPSYFWLVTEQNTVLRIPFFSTGMELYQDIFMKCLNLHSVDTAQDCRWHCNGIVPGYIHEMFKPSLCRYSTRSQMALGIPLQKTNTGQKSLSFLGSKIWSKIGLYQKYQSIVFFYACY